MDFDEIVNDMQTMAAELEATRKRHMEEMQTKFKNATTAFFEAAPNVQAVIWSQYTPYFNDGEECVFSVNTPVFVTKNFDPENLEDPYEYEDDEEYGSESFYYRGSAEKSNFENAQVCYEFANIIESESELMEAVFGNHVAVYLTRDEVYVEEYSHD